MRINTKVVFEWDLDTKEYKEVYSEGYEYGGEIDLLQESESMTGQKKLNLFTLYDDEYKEQKRSEYRKHLWKGIEIKHGIRGRDNEGKPSKKHEKGVALYKEFEKWGRSLGIDDDESPEQEAEAQRRFNIWYNFKGTNLRYLRGTNFNRENESDYEKGIFYDPARFSGWSKNYQQGHELDEFLDYKIGKDIDEQDKLKIRRIEDNLIDGWVIGDSKSMIQGE